MGLIDDAAIRERTKRTSATLFKGVRNEVGFEHWKRFDKGLARDLSLFFTGVLYSREVISQKQRELCAVASLTVLHRPKELHVHIHAALNVGRHPPRGRRGDLPAGHVRRHAGRGRRAGGLRQGPHRARRALPGRGDARDRQPSWTGRWPPRSRRPAPPARSRMRYYRTRLRRHHEGRRHPGDPGRPRRRAGDPRGLGPRVPRARASSARSSAPSAIRRRAGSSIPSTARRTSSATCPIWATLIGLEEHGEVTVGVIHNPVTGELLAARRGGGALAQRRARARLGDRRAAPGHAAARRAQAPARDGLLGRLRAAGRRDRPPARLRRLPRLRARRRGQGRDLRRDRSQGRGTWPRAR